MIAAPTNILHIRAFGWVQGSWIGMVGSRAGEHQQNGWSGDQEIAGSSDPERRIDAEGNTGDQGNTRGENACTAVDAPEPGPG